MAYRERQKISQMTPKGSDLSSTDLVEVSVLESGSYVTKSITGQEIINAASGGALDLQAVTDNGNITTNNIEIQDSSLYVSNTIDETTVTQYNSVVTENETNITRAGIYNDGSLMLKAGAEQSTLKNTNVTNAGVNLEFPNKTAGSYTIATTSDLTSGYVPYTGATQDVDLGTNKISTKSVYVTGTAGNGHLHLKHQSSDATATGQSTALWADTNGDIKWKNDSNYKTILKTSANTADRTYTFPNETCTLTPDSRSLTINGTSQDLSANRTFTVTDANLSMSDITTNNVSITQHGFVPKAPNDTTKFLRGDGTWATAGGGLTIGTTAITSGTVGRILFEGSGNVLQEDSALFWDNTNKRLGVGATPSTSVRLDVRAQGALSTDIAFRIRNSADTADLISFRGDGSEWIQSVPFRHAAYLTGGTNTAQGLFIGYNVASLSSTSDNCVVVGRGSGSVLQGSGNTIIGHAFSQGTVSNSIGLGRGVFVNGSNQFITGSELYPTNTWLVSTGGEVTTGANLRGLDFKVSGTANGPSNISAAAYPVRFYSPNGTGSGAGSNIQFHVAPSNTGGAAFNKNIFSEMFTIRGEADGLNHYQLSTPRVPSASITDGYIQYSNDITAGNAAPHFRTENGNIIKLYRETTAVAAQAFVANTSGIVNDTATFGGYTIGQIVGALKAQGLLA